MPPRHEIRRHDARFRLLLLLLMLMLFYAAFLFMLRHYAAYDTPPPPRYFATPRGCHADTLTMPDYFFSLYARFFATLYCHAYAYSAMLSSAIIAGQVIDDGLLMSCRRHTPCQPLASMLR